jgi:hypothetical protein
LRNGLHKVSPVSKRQIRDSEWSLILCSFTWSLPFPNCVNITFQARDSTAEKNELMDKTKQRHKDWGSMLWSQFSAMFAYLLRKNWRFS